MWAKFQTIYKYFKIRRNSSFLNKFRLHLQKGRDIFTSVFFPKKQKDNLVLCTKTSQDFVI